MHSWARLACPATSSLPCPQVTSQGPAVSLGCSPAGAPGFPQGRRHLGGEAPDSLGSSGPPSLAALPSSPGTRITAFFEGAHLCQGV